MPTNRDIILSFVDLFATYTLPDSAATLVTAVLPKIADFVFPPETVNAYVDGKVTLGQTIITQDGKTFNIIVSEKTTPQVHAALLRIHRQINSTGQDDAVRTQQFFSLQVAPEEGAKAPAAGAFSFLNGIIGVSW